MELELAKENLYRAYQFGIIDLFQYLETFRKLNF